MESRIDMEQWTHEPYRAGDRVILKDASGTVQDVYPDGVHVVQLDRSGELVAAVEWQLERADRDSGSHTTLRRAV
jgi:hypothetical protein